MKCVHFKKRFRLIPLPKVLRQIVDTYLANDLIPSLVLEIQKDHVVIGVCGSDIYTLYRDTVYKNKEYLWSNMSHGGCVTHVKRDWVLFRARMFSRHNTESDFYLPDHLRAIVVNRGYVYYVADCQVNKFNVTTRIHSVVPDTERVYKIIKLGNCLTYLSRNGLRRLHGDNRETTGDQAMYMWNKNLYVFEYNGIRKIYEPILFFFDTPIESVHAINHMLLVVGLTKNYIVDLNKMTQIIIPRTGDVWCNVWCSTNDKRVYTQIKHQLFIYS